MLYALFIQTGNLKYLLSRLEGIKYYNWVGKKKIIVNF